MPVVSYLSHQDADMKAAMALTYNTYPVARALMDENAAGALLGFENCIQEVKKYFATYNVLDEESVRALVIHLNEIKKSNTPGR